jgi:hypothetical protein
MGSTRYTIRRPKYGNAIPSLILNIDLFDYFPMTSVKFWHENNVIKKFIFLSFHLYVECPNRTTKLLGINSTADWFWSPNRPWSQVRLGFKLFVHVPLTLHHLLVVPIALHVPFLSSKVQLHNLLSNSWMEEHMTGFTYWLSCRALALLIGPCMITGAGLLSSPSASISLASWVVKCSAKSPSVETVSISTEDWSVEYRSTESQSIEDWSIESRLFKVMSLSMRSWAQGHVATQVLVPRGGGAGVWPQVQGHVEAPEPVPRGGRAMGLRRRKGWKFKIFWSP